MHRMFVNLFLVVANRNVLGKTRKDLHLFIPEWAMDAGPHRYGINSLPVAICKNKIPN